jgi:DNA repair protein RecO (recombination protein O)
MPRLIVKTKAIVLRARRMGETSKLVTFFTEEFGKLKVTAKGCRKPKSKFGASLELMTEVQVVCYLREDRDLQTLSDCDLLREHPSLLGDLQLMSYGSAACEMIDRLTIDQEPNKRIYACLKGVLRGLEEVAAPQVEPLFWYFQLRLTEALGYRPELTECVGCRQGLATRGEVAFSPSLGGGLCRPCARGGGAGAVGEGRGEAVLEADGGYHYPGWTEGGYPVAAESMDFLARLQGLATYRKEAIPPRPHAGGEIRRMLRGFVEYHCGQSGRLKALEFLD